MQERIEYLDSLRGIAAMIVVVFHCLLSFSIFYEANYYNKFENWSVELFSVTPLHTLWAGKEAVLLFFVLSGFVLAIPFFNGRQPNYFSYVIRRFFRIYMPYIAVMAISVILVNLFFEYKNVVGMSPTYDVRWDHEVSLKTLIAFIVMINSDIANVNGVVWSLFHEMRISIIFPFFLAILLRFSFIKSVAISLGANLLLFFLFSLAGSVLPESYALSFILSFKESVYYCFFFIMGALLSKHRNNLTMIEGASLKTKLLLLIISSVLINGKWLTVYLGIDNERITDFVAVFGILLLFALVLTTENFKKVLMKKPLLWLGKVSFSLYMVHIPVLMLTTIFLGKVILIEIAFMLVPFISLPVAYISYKYIEVPFNEMGKKISKKTSLKTTATQKRYSS